MDSSAADFVETPSLDRPWGRMGRARLEAWCGRVVALAVGEVVVAWCCGGKGEAELVSGVPGCDGG
jgi:hypothetical protein